MDNPPPADNPPRVTQRPRTRHPDQQTRAQRFILLAEAASQRKNKLAATNAARGRSSSVGRRVFDAQGWIVFPHCSRSKPDGASLTRLPCTPISSKSHFVHQPAVGAFARETGERHAAFADGGVQMQLRLAARSGRACRCPASHGHPRSVHADARRPFFVLLRPNHQLRPCMNDRR